MASDDNIATRVTPLDEERERLIDRHAILIEAGLVLASELSLPAVLQRIVELATLVTDAKYGALGILGDDERLTDFVTVGITDDERRRIGDLPVGRGILGALIEEPWTLRLRSIAEDPRSVGFPASHPPMRSFLGAPVKGKMGVFGNVYLTEKQGADEFSEEDEQALVVLAAQAAIAIENAKLYAEVSRNERSLDAFREFSIATLEGASTDDVLRVVARRARELVGADLACVVTPLGDDPDVLTVRVADGSAADRLEGRTLGVEDSLAGVVLRSGEPVLTDDVAGDPRSAQFLARTGDVGPAILVPLEAGGEVFGVLSVANQRGRRSFRKDDFDMVEEFAIRASLAMQYGRAQEEVRRLTVVADRERIAKDIHDGAIQSLFAVGMSLQGTAAIVADARVAERIEKAVQELDGVIRDLRSYIFELRPSVLAGRQVHDALRHLAGEIEDRTDVVLVLELDPGVSTKLASNGSTVVHLVREALSNVVRHAGAQTCRVLLTQDSGMALLEIDDDGTGFDVTAAHGRGNGLRNLRERAMTVGGDVEISSSRGEGTTVRIRLPLDR